MANPYPYPDSPFSGNAQSLSPQMRMIGLLQKNDAQTQDDGPARLPQWVQGGQTNIPKSQGFAPQQTPLPSWVQDGQTNIPKSQGFPQPQPSQPPSAESLPWWAQTGQIPQSQGFPQQQAVPLPRSRPPEAPSQFVPLPRARPDEAPSAAADNDPLGWFTRNAFLQRDETGAYLDPELARRALGQG